MTAAVVATDDVVAYAERADAFTEVLADRWSCRAFLPDPVPTDVLRRMFDMAQRTASWCNTQPWHVYVATGGSVRDLASRLVDSAQTSTGNPDIAPPEEYVGVYRERRREAGFALYRSLGIEREDREGRAQQMLKNFEFFDAPHVAIITTDRLQGLTARSTAVAT